MTSKECEEIKDEIEILRDLDHPNIVKMIDNYEEIGHYCIVMEKMNGGEVSAIKLISIFAVVR
jgi:serine/threonine protein kinase